MGVFINVSNHTSAKWSEKQLQEAGRLGEVIDIPFPQIAPEATKEEIGALAQEYLHKIEAYQVSGVMVQGEFTFSYALIKRLRERGFMVVAACTRRQVEEQTMADGTVVKNSVFVFSGFREYE